VARNKESEMTKAGDRLIAGASEAVAWAAGQVDACMLRSMAVSFRSGLGFSFNPNDMADLLERCADGIDAAIPAHVREVLPNGGRSK
jgi:hypothetical protein